MSNCRLHPHTAPCTASAPPPSPTDMDLSFGPPNPRLPEAVNCSAKDTGPGATCIMREFDDSPRWLNLTHHWREVVHTAAAIGGVQPV